MIKTGYWHIKWVLVITGRDHSLIFVTIIPKAINACNKLLLMQNNKIMFLSYGNLGNLKPELMFNMGCLRLDS